MWRSILTAFAAAQATSTVRKLIQQTLLALFAVLLLFIAVSFASIAAYLYLSTTQGEIYAAITVSGIIFLVAVILLFAALYRGRKSTAGPLETVEDMVSPLVQSDQFKQVSKDLTRIADQMGPYKLIGLALFLGFMLAKR